MLWVLKLFVAFSWVETSTGPGGFMICVFINMTGTPEGSTESGFMEKPGIEPATPGLQGIALIHWYSKNRLNDTVLLNTQTYVKIDE